MVNFIGEKSHAKLDPSDVKKFEKHFDQLKAVNKKPYFVDAVASAVKILEGTSTFKGMSFFLILSGTRNFSGKMEEQK